MGLPAEPPGTPGAREVSVGLSLVKEYAQKEAQARQKWRESVAAKNAAARQYNAICTRLEKMPQKLFKRVHENKLDKATAALNAAKIAVGEARCEILEQVLCKQLCQIEVRDAKLRSDLSAAASATQHA